MTESSIRPSKTGSAMLRLDDTAYCAPTASCSGSVIIGRQSSIWPGAVLTGHAGAIRIGARSAIQKDALVTAGAAGGEVVIGDGVTVGQMAVIRACRLEEGCFIGMKACVMDGAVVEAGAMLAAGSRLAKGARVPAGQLWAGNPARHVRDLTADETAAMAIPAAHFADLAAAHLAAMDEDAGPHTPACDGGQVLALSPAARSKGRDWPGMPAAMGLHQARQAHASRLPANGRRARAAGNCRAVGAGRMMTGQLRVAC